jgi:prepilin-type N-terminal cleavage/methylation domain-containing protein
MKTNNKKRGFTLIEILVIVAIITILVTLSLVSLMNGQSKAQDNSAFTSFKSIAAPALMCLNSGAALTAFDPYNNLCNNPAAAADSNWPSFAKYGWDNFSWCNVNTSIAVKPGTGAYDGITYGGNSSSGRFCFMLKKGTDKTMWCNAEGCKKEGF